MTLTSKNESIDSFFLLNRSTSLEGPQSLLANMRGDWWFRHRINAVAGDGRDQNRIENHARKLGDQLCR